MSQEIEKKFLLVSEPEDLEVVSKEFIYQTYLAIGDQELRVRKVVTEEAIKCTLTLKTGTGLVREEQEIEISGETYKQITKSVSTKPIIKNRKKVKLEDKICSIDTYVNVSDLIVAEVEFDTVEESKAFVKPSWFGQDVTENERYKNQNIWKDLQEIQNN